VGRSVRFVVLELVDAACITVRGEAYGRGMASNTAERAHAGAVGAAGGGPVVPGLFRRTGPENGSQRFFWGIDPGTVRVSVGVVNEDGELVAARTQSFTAHKPRSFERLATIHDETGQLLRALAVEFPPAFVLVEEPTGKVPNPQLVYAAGCIMACVPMVGAGALVPVSSWKLAATGHGYRPGLPRSAPAGERRKAEKARLLRWAQQHGYGGSLEDEADAVGIAFACRALRLAPQQLALA